MLKSVIKRDERVVGFDVNRITEAIYKAAQSVGGSDYNQAVELTYKVVDRLDRYNVDVTSATTVEHIQDMVEEVLIKEGHAKTAKAFIIYRNERTKKRERNSRFVKNIHDITVMDSKDSDVKRENANVDGDTPMGTMLKYGTETSKLYYLQYMLNPEHAKAHVNGDIHIHDLDFYSLTTTCCQLDLEKLFEGGFNTGHGFLREPNDILTYSAQACIAIQSNQNDQHGGQSVPKFDFDLGIGVAKSFIKKLKLVMDIRKIEYTDTFITRLKEYVLKNKRIMDDDGYGVLFDYFNYKLSHVALNDLLISTIELVKKDTYQAMEALVHNLNTMHSRAGAQVPFSSINFGTDTSEEGRLVSKMLLESVNAGLGNGETAIFPITIFKVKEGVNYHEEDPNYDLFKLACKVSAKRLFPNFSFLDAPYNLHFYKEGRPETEVAYMGCRTRVIGNVWDPEREIVTNRGNLSFTSINLPRLAIESGSDMDKFIPMLKEKINLTFDQLKERLEVQKSRPAKSFPFLMGQNNWMDSEGLHPDEPVGDILNHGTLTIGFIGLAECLKVMTGYHHGEHAEAQKLGLDIVKIFKDMSDEKSKEEKLNFTVIATPAEGLSGRFINMDREKYGTIAGVTDKEYYTNSYHVPVDFDIPATDKIRLEAPYHQYTNAGHITYVEMDGDPSKNLDAFEDIVRVMKESGVGYGSINHPVDRDPVCGYNGIIDDTCPECGREEGEVPFDRIRRITGYLVGTTDRFNNAKMAELNSRVKHG